MASEGSGMNTCSCQVCNDVRARLNKIFRMLDTFGWLLDTYIVDFFEENVWNKLPLGWRKVLDDVSPEELGEWVLGSKSCRARIWPLSLLAFRQTIKVLGINRDYARKEIFKCCGTTSSIDGQQTQKILKSPGMKCKRIDSNYDTLFTKSVKKKKRHEIENIAETTAECAAIAKCECIVDIGAGMGHLARTLAYNYGLSVLCLEQNKSLSQQARKCDENLLVMLRKKIPDILDRNPRHVSIKIGESNVQGRELAEKLKTEFFDNFNRNELKSDFGLIGLHTCGDLAATLLRFYAQQEDAKFICIVGCCYMKITCGTKETGCFGYPLSEYVSTIKNHKLSYAALEVACHAIESHCDKLRSGDYQDLLVHAYRATLETILIKKNGKSIRRSHLKNVKLKENMTFERYCTNATENLNILNKPEISDLETDKVSACLNRWRQVVTFGTFRFMLAPLVETAVLLDRFLYLSELNLTPTLQPIFDPRISPRNIILTSCK